jgi:hypothetical protein
MLRGETKRARRVLALPGPTYKDTCHFPYKPGKNLDASEVERAVTEKQKGPASVALLAGPNGRRTRYFLLSAERPLCKRNGAGFT